jgi:hypothetical protein
MDNSRELFTFTETELVGDTLKRVGKDFGVVMFRNESDDSYRYRLLSHLDNIYPVKVPQQKTRWFYMFVWLFTLPWDVVAFLIVLLTRVFFGQRLFWENGLWCELKHSWWTKRYNGAAIGHGGILSPGMSGSAGVDTTTEFHEHVHVEQFEVSMTMSFIFSFLFFLVSFFISGEVSIFAPALVWLLGYPVFILSGLFISFLRGEHPYFGSQHEEAAYALAKAYEEAKRGLR